MKKRYLKTVEDVVALKGTNTKIYNAASKSYYKFIDGILCRFFDNEDKDVWYNTYLPIGRNSEFYILEEEKEYEKSVQEANEKDLGCLCYCWDEEDDKEELGILEDYDKSDDDKYHITGLGWFQHCRRLSPSEVAEITGYKVSFADQRDVKVEEAE